MTDTVDPRLLRCFLTLLDTRSFKLAAERLGQSQSATTKSLQRLEHALDCTLFDRTTRSVIPTAEALQLRAQAEAAMRGLEAFSAEARVLAGGGANTLRVGAIALSVESLVAPALAGLRKTHPEIQVEVIVGSADVYADLATGECDIVVGDRGNFESSTHAGAMRMQPLRDEPLVAVFRQGHPASNANDLSELLAFPWAIPSRYFTENSSLQGLAQRVSDANFPQYRMTSLSACLILAAQSDSIALAPLSVVKTAAYSGLNYLDLAQELDLNLYVGLAMFTLNRVSPGAAVHAFQHALQAA